MSTTSKNVSVSPRIEHKCFNNNIDFMTQIKVSDETPGAMFFMLSFISAPVPVSTATTNIFAIRVVPLCPKQNKNNNLREAISKTRGQVSQFCIKLRYLCVRHIICFVVWCCVSCASRGISIGRTQEIIKYLPIMRNINLHTFN